ncbi:MAG: acyltransferase [Siculibacillus sp.]|nr:acyltransferase [Siculibacillus sp.]
MADDERYLGIEALRFLSAVAVVFWHYQHFYLSVDDVFLVPFTRDREPLWWLFRAFYDHGYLAVWVFWQISGFIFFWKYHEAIARGEVGSWRFFVLRFSRLYPLHFATLLVVAVLQGVYALGHQGAFFVYADNDLRHFALNLVFAPAWGFEKAMSFNGPIWSVSVEVVIYALFFALSTLGRSGLVRRVAVAAVAIVLLGLNSRYGPVPGARMILNCVAYFFIGGAIHATIARLSPELLRRAAPAALAAALVLAWATFRGETDTPKWAALGFTSLVVFGALGLDGWPAVERLLERVAPLADTTYSSYLVHFPIQIAAVALTDRLGFERSIYDSPLALIGFLLATFWLGWVVFHRFERPAQTWLRRCMLTAVGGAKRSGAGG